MRNNKQQNLPYLTNSFSNVTVSSIVLLKIKSIRDENKENYKSGGAIFYLT